jgi:hypothetical protein
MSEGTVGARTCFLPRRIPIPLKQTSFTTTHSSRTKLLISPFNWHLQSPCRNWSPNYSVLVFIFVRSNVRTNIVRILYEATDWLSSQGGVILRLFLYLITHSRYYLMIFSRYIANLNETYVAFPSLSALCSNLCLAAEQELSRDLLSHSCKCFLRVTC